MNALDTLSARLGRMTRKSGGRRRRAPLRPRLEGLEDRVVLVGGPSTTMLKIAPTGSQTYGTTLTLTADVTHPGTIPETKGAVTFKAGSQVLGTSPLNSTGAATLETVTLPVGDDTITASYGGAYQWVEEIFPRGSSASHGRVRQPFGD